MYGGMFREIFAGVLIVAASAGFGAVDMPDLPNFPKLPISSASLDEVLASDSANAWTELADRAKDEALKAATKKNFSVAADWLYLSKAARLFAQNGGEIPVEFKRAMLSDMPAFYDFYESATKHDAFSNALEVASKIFLNQPAQAKKYMRAVLTLGLIYDFPPPARWPECEVVSPPTQITMPQEVFLYFSLKAEKLPFDLRKLTVAELVWTLGVAGPLTELEAAFEPNFKPTSVENAISAIRTDSARVRGSRVSPWDETKSEFTLANLRKNGGSPYEKIYYAWRVANANGVPCIFFSATVRNQPHAWLAHMTSAGEWKTDVARDAATRSTTASPLNPQTWQPLTSFEIETLRTRGTVSETHLKSATLSHLADELLREDKFPAARDYAKDAIETDPKNFAAYGILVSASARCGAESKELDAIYKSGYVAFANYPELSTQMLNLYRENLIARKRAKEADALFDTHIKHMFRANPQLACRMISDELDGLLTRMHSDAERMAFCSSLIRKSAKIPVECAKYVAIPAAKYFAQKGEFKNAVKVLKYAEPSVKRAGSIIEGEFALFRDECEAAAKQERAATDSEMHTHKNKKTGNEPEKGDDIESF